MALFKRLKIQAAKTNDEPITKIHHPYFPLTINATTTTIPNAIQTQFGRISKSLNLDKTAPSAEVLGIVADTIGKSLIKVSISLEILSFAFSFPLTNLQLAWIFFHC